LGSALFLKGQGIMSCAHLLDPSKFDIHDNVAVHGLLIMCSNNQDIKTFSEIMKRLADLKCSEIKQVLFYKPYEQWYGNLLHSLFITENPSGKCLPEDTPEITTKVDYSMMEHDGLVYYYTPHSQEFRDNFDKVANQMARLVLNLARTHDLAIELLEDRDYYDKLPIISNTFSSLFYYNRSVLSGFTKFAILFKNYTFQKKA